MLYGLFVCCFMRVCVCVCAFCVIYCVMLYGVLVCGLFVFVWFVCASMSVFIYEVWYGVLLLVLCCSLL